MIYVLTQLQSSMRSCRLPLWGRISAELLADPSCISLSDPPEERLTGSKQLLFYMVSVIAGPYFLLLLSSKDTAFKMYVIWAGVLTVATGVIIFGWAQFVTAAATK